MMQTRRFLTALQVAAILAEARGEAIDSYLLATRVRLAPSVLRRSLRPLIDAGLITTRSGPGGGAKLTRRPHEITLADLWRATISASPFGDIDPDPAWLRPDPFVTLVAAAITPLLARAAAALEDSLAQTSLADFADLSRPPHRRPARCVEGPEPETRRFRASRPRLPLDREPGGPGSESAPPLPG